LKVFLEPQETTDVEGVLRDYAVACHASVCTLSVKTCASQAQVRKKLSTNKGVKGGAVLFAVIGAKLSEGLNFSDDLARAVIIIGLPFANLRSPELRERMKYVNKLENQSGVQRKPGQKDAAAELYENMCMNAVNQSIGEHAFAA
jgi:chromosome transmission fidelity protein 1